MTAGRAAAAVALAGLVGVAWACALEPEYLLSRGLPLDGAWLHAVYGRALARWGMLAYNPGIPATGATSPLWAVVLAGLHLVTPVSAGPVLGIKLLGAALHVLAAVLLVRAFTENGRVELAALIGCLLVAVHPDLVSAGLSGMEVALAASLASGLLLAAVRAGPAWYGLLSFVAALARPELALLGLALPVTLLVRRDHRRLLILTVAAFIGSAFACGLMGLRNVAVSGWPLPASYYARVGAGPLGILGAEITGFRDLLGRLTIVDSSILLLIAVLVALRLVAARQPSSAPRQRAAAAMLAGVFFCAVSFVLIPPVDPRAFFHQRYVLPAMSLMVAAIPLLASAALERLLPDRPRRLVQAALLALLVLAVLVVAPLRYATLRNDAHNIDDVQVRIGRSLTAARPEQIVWAIDPGAIRYFGNAFVVDLIGLNNTEMLGPDAQRFLDGHAPGYIEIVPMWSDIDDVSGLRLDATHFRTSTVYTVTSYPRMREHWLVVCDDATVTGQVAVGRRTFAFRCAGSPSRRGHE